MDYGLWTMDDRLWTMDDGRWTVDYGPFHGHAINLFVTSQIKHTPYETLLAVYFLFLQLRQVASRKQSLRGFLFAKSLFSLSIKRYHLSLAKQRKTISCDLFKLLLRDGISLHEDAFLQCSCVTQYL